MKITNLNDLNVRHSLQFKSHQWTKWRKQYSVIFKASFYCSFNDLSTVILQKLPWSLWSYINLCYLIQLMFKAPPGQVKSFYIEEGEI